jgi:uroporphyrinogen-III synthase
MRVIVTRPLRDAHNWVRDLSAAGFDALALPLIEIQAMGDTQALQQVWGQLPSYAGVMFVSGHAVDGFFAARPDGAVLFSRAWATGPGTRAALLRAGVEPQNIDAPPAEAGQFDSEALWRVMGEQVRPGSRVLIVRGADGQAAPAQGAGRDWFAQRVQEAGGRVDFAVAYQRCLPHWSEAQLQQARQAAGDGSIWIFSSSEAVLNLRACLPQQDWHAARAIATHARIAAAARQIGFGVVCESRPMLAEIKASIESMR